MNSLTTFEELAAACLAWNWVKADKADATWKRLEHARSYAEQLAIFREESGSRKALLKGELRKAWHRSRNGTLNLVRV